MDYIPELDGGDVRAKPRTSFGMRTPLYKGGGGGGTSTTTQEIPNELKPLATAYANKAIDLSKLDYTPYTGQRYADLNAYQTTGADAIANRAANGSQEINAGSNMLTDTLNGNYLNGNSHLSAMYDSAAQDMARNYQNATNSTDSVAARAGAFGGSAWQQMQSDNSQNLADGLGNLSNQIHYQNYATERNNQMNALNPALNYGNQAYTDGAQMINAGQMYQDQAQQGMDFNYDQFMQEQNLPYKQLAAMSGVFGTYPGGSSTTTQTGGGGK